MNDTESVIDGVSATFRSKFKFDAISAIDRSQRPSVESSLPSEWKLTPSDEESGTLEDSAIEEYERRQQKLKQKLEPPTSNVSLMLAEASKK